MNTAAAFAAGTVVLATSLAAAQEVPGRPGAYREDARVERVIVDAHVTDSDGEAIPYLTASDFQVKVDGSIVPIESAEWIPAEVPEVAAPPPALAAGRADAVREPASSSAPPGRLLILLFQTSHLPVRLTGLMRMALQAHRLAESLLPTDRVAVFSFDSHLKLRQDFTADRAKIGVAIDRSLLTGVPPSPDPEASPSLAQSLDFHGASKAVTPERALLLIAQAAQPIPGAKTMLFFGWGLGTIGGTDGPIADERNDYLDAMRRLAAARISIFTLDVTDADFHSLENSLQVVSDQTGGQYLKTHLFPNLVMDRVRRAISGRYVLVLRKPDGPRGFHTIGVELVGTRGQVTARTFFED